MCNSKQRQHITEQITTDTLLKISKNSIWHYYRVKRKNQQNRFKNVHYGQATFSSGPCPKYKRYSLLPWWQPSDNHKYHIHGKWKAVLSLLTSSSLHFKSSIAIKVEDSSLYIPNMKLLTTMVSLSNYIAWWFVAITFHGQ